MEMRIAEDGEVMVRSPGVFAGYWEDPERTAEVLETDGWYHTGDVGEISPDGFLTLRGRKKDMLAMPDGTRSTPRTSRQSSSRTTGSATLPWSASHLVRT